MKKLRCFAIEDNELDRLMFQHILRQYDCFDFLGFSESPEEALPLPPELDVLFLDIDFGGMNGIEFRKRTKDIPACVFISSHPEYAVESFEADALDFVSKPLKKERFDATVSRLRDYFSMKEKSDFYDILIGNRVLNIKEGHDIIPLKIDDVKYVEALKDYTRLITHQRNYYVLKSLGQLLKEESFAHFIRIHKSFAVPRHLITRKTSTEILVDNRWNLPLGRAFKGNLQFFDR